MRVVRVGVGSSELTGQGRSQDLLGNIVPPLRTGVVQAETPVCVEREVRPGPVDLPCEVANAVRKTSRVTAGHHSNVNRLPRPAIGPSGAVNAVTAVFRPWI